MSGETIDGGAPYEFDDAGHDGNANWKDEIQPAKESDEKGFFVEPGGEGDVNKDLRDLMPIAQTDGGIEFKQDPEDDQIGLDITDDVDLPPIEVLTFEDLKKVRLQRRRTVMERDMEVEPVEGFFRFTAKDADGLITAAYLMAAMDWEAFGCPDTITVGVVTGDILND